MTIKEKLLERITELEALRAGLLRKEPFLDPNNNSFIYSTEDIADLEGTQGTTPLNLSEILEKVVDEINKYVEYIKNLPFAESSVIYRERPDVDLALVASNRKAFSIPMVWESKALNVSVQSIYSYLAMSKFYGSIRKMKIYSTPTFRKNDFNGREIDFEIKMFKINNRLNILSEFRSGTGPLDVTITDDDLNADDLFFMCIVVNEPLFDGIVYYQDFTYTIEIENFDGSKENTIHTVGNRRIGNTTMEGDTTLNGASIYWDMLAVDRPNITVKTTLGDTYPINTSQDGPLSATHADGNMVAEMTIESFTVDMSRLKLSYRGEIASYKTLLSDTYSLYDMNISNVASIVFNNLKPIDQVLEDAINEL